MNERSKLFIKGIEREYNEYMERLLHAEPAELLDNVYHICAAKIAYRYMKHINMDAHINYLSQFREPLQAVADLWETELVYANETELFERMLFEVVEQDKLEEYERVRPGVSNAVFYLNPKNVDEVCAHQDAESNQGIQAAAFIEMAVVLTPDDYHTFCRDLSQPQTFIEDHASMMFAEDDGPWHCILVTCIGGERGAVLVEANDYPYPRYAAYVPDISRLDLENVEIVTGVAGEYTRGAKQRPMDAER